MLQPIVTRKKNRLNHKLTVVHLKQAVTQKESLKADQNSDPSHSAIRGLFADTRSAWVRSNYYPDGPGGNYSGF
ncbi:MAG: hypothetical protein JWP88_923 [Flaviaesturariibacter sp.]|nr:hypothetical protein [Flaviaesturariibacter sp.]